MKQVPYYPSANDGRVFICFLATAQEMLDAGYVPAVTTADGVSVYWTKVRQSIRGDKR